MGLIQTQSLSIGQADSYTYRQTASLSNNQGAGAANLTVTTADGSAYRVQWGDGNVSDPVASGAEATNTYAGSYDGPVIIRAGGKISAISSTAGGWDFDIADLPENIVTFDMSYAAAAITGSVLPHSIEYVDLSNSASVLTFDLADVPASLKYLDLTSTNSVITAASQTTRMTSGRAVLLGSTNMTAPTVEDVLAALATITTWVTEQAVTLDGNNEAPTSNADADIATLEGNGVTVTNSVAGQLVFNGTDQYATMSNYSTLGDSDVYRAVTYTTDNEDGYVIDLTSEPISEFGRVGANYHSGTIVDLSVADTSPIQNTTAMAGDGSKTLTLPRIVINGGFTLEFDWRRQAETSDFTLVTGQDALKTATSSIVIKGTDDIVLTDINGVTATITDAVIDVVDGQHCHIKLRAVEDYEVDDGETTQDVNDFICYVDGVESARVSMTDISTLYLDFSTLGPMPTNMLVQNLKINPEVYPQWVFPLAEGSGTTAYNSSDTMKYERYITNVQAYSSDLTAQTGTVPPPEPPPPGPTERLDVTFFSGAERGPNWPAKASTEDGWSRQNLTPHLDEALQLCLASDFGITARAGTRVLRAYYNFADWGYDTGGKCRSEVLKPAGNLVWLNGGPEYWVGFSIYVGKDNANNRSVINYSGQNAHIFQFHEQTGLGTSGMNMHDGRWDFSFGDNDGSEQVIGDPIELGRWYDFVLNFKLSTGSDGFTKLWIDAASESDTPAYEYYGNNGSRWPSGMYMKLGVYTNAIDGSVNGTVGYAEHFYDEIRIATGSNANFNSVKPG